jgi:RimJ/RimL family protein N-acetyltransferase
MKSETTDGGGASVTMRPVSPEDAEFLLKVYASTRAAEMAMVPWNEAQREAFIKTQFAAQLAHYSLHNPRATHDIILLGESPVGRLYVARREAEIRILDITILPEHRSLGIGTPIIERLMDEAARANLPLSIYIESFNPSLRLFERLGFKMVESDGVNQLMEWRV